jgi:hypothetical protein
MHVVPGVDQLMPRGSNPMMSKYFSELKKSSGWAAESGSTAESMRDWMELPSKSAKYAPGPPGPPGLMRTGPPYRGSSIETRAGSLVIARLMVLSGYVPLK